MLRQRTVPVSSMHHDDAGNYCLPHPTRLQPEIHVRETYEQPNRESYGNAADCEVLSLNGWWQASSRGSRSRDQVAWTPTFFASEASLLAAIVTEPETPVRCHVAGE